MSKLEMANQPDNSNGDYLKQKRKKKVQVACVFCRRSHMICDNNRPCTRCVKRNISHLCRDELNNSKAKKPRTGELSEENEATQQPEKATEILEPGPVTSPSDVKTSDNGTSNHLKVKQEVRPNEDIVLDQSNSFSNLYPYNGANSSSRNTASNMSILSQLHPFSNQAQPFFYSEHANSEFSSLNEFLSMIDDPEVVSSVNNQYSKGISQQNSFSDLQNFNSMSFNQIPGQMFNGEQQHQSQRQQQIQPPQQPPQPLQQPQIDSGLVNDSQSGLTEPTPETRTEMISDSAKDKFFLTAADPSTEITPEERLKQVIKAKLDAGLLQPYNYAKGYARLQNYMDNYMNQQSRQRIMKPLSIFRPAFRAIARTLKDVDLVLVEEAFERMLLDYDRVFTSMAIPACLWRRTGEIYRGNKEFAQLVEVNSDALKDGKLKIYELMSEESAVNFWEKYGAIAFDKGQKAVLTSCNLRTKDGRKRKSCCFSFTIRRDRYNIPSVIVGNFIPIDN